jgi:hypothetical protein
MSTIASINSSATSAVASLLSDAASAATAGGSSASTATKSNQAASSASGDPVDIVDLSDHARQILARTKTEQVAAGKLSDLVQSLKSPDGKNAASKTKSNDTTSLFDKLSGRAQTQAGNDTQWVAGAPYGDASKSDTDFVKGISLLQMADGMDRDGLHPEAGQALRNAVANGTVKIQKASDVPGLNFSSQHTFTKNAFGTIDTWGTTSQNPTGAIKDAIDQGKALAMWTADRGDIYITW